MVNGRSIGQKGLIFIHKLSQISPYRQYQANSSWLKQNNIKNKNIS